MDVSNPMTFHGDDAVNRFILKVTIPLLADVETPNPVVLGTGTLFSHEGRRFLVTADHILKEDENDLTSATIDLKRVAFPQAQVKAGMHRLGTVEVHRHDSAANIDVAVIELLDPDSIGALDRGWGALGFDLVGPYPAEGDFMVNGFLFEGATAVGGNIGQKFLAFGTVPLDHTPTVSRPNPALDRFLLLQSEAEYPDGSRAQVPNFKGMSGASVWSLTETVGVWDPSRALRVVGVQCAAKAGHWIQCTAWPAVLDIFRSPQVGFQSPP